MQWFCLGYLIGFKEFARALPCALIQVAFCWLALLPFHIWVRYTCVLFYIYPWFNVFELVSILFAIVPGYGNEYITKIEPVLKILHQN